MNNLTSKMDTIGAAGLIALALYISLSGPVSSPEMSFVTQIMILLFLLRGGAILLLSFAEIYFEPTYPSLTSHPLVSIIVPCYNEEKVIQGALRSLLKLNYPNFEIIVVDDGSTDNTFLAAKQLESEGRLRVIYQANQGKSHALNNGISEAQGDYVMCIDADGAIAPDSIMAGLPILLSDPRIAAVAGDVQISNTGKNGNLLTAFQRLEYVAGLNFLKTAQSYLSMVNVISGCIGLFRKSAILKVGGYRSDTYAEDFDITVRFLINDYRVLYTPKMAAITEAPEDITSFVKQRYRWIRGTIQAINVHSHLLMSPFKRPRAFGISLYLVTETFFFPIFNTVLGARFLFDALSGQFNLVSNHYILSLISLEMFITGYVSYREGGKVQLLILTCLYRFSYGLGLEVIRLFSMIDEIFKLPMTWNKLQRKGL